MVAQLLYCAYANYATLVETAIRTWLWPASPSAGPISDVHGLASGQKPSQKCWPGYGFGLAWTSWKPKPMAQAMALSTIFVDNYYQL
jgi:hypothetical protein